MGMGLPDSPAAAETVNAAAPRLSGTQKTILKVVGLVALAVLPDAAGAFIPAKPGRFEPPAEGRERPIDEIVLAGTESSIRNASVARSIPLEIERAHAHGKSVYRSAWDGTAKSLGQILLAYPTADVTIVCHGAPKRLNSSLAAEDFASIPHAPGRTIRLVACEVGLEFAPELAKRTGCAVQAPETQLDSVTDADAYFPSKWALGWAFNLKADAQAQRSAGRGVDPDGAWFTYRPDGTKTPLQLPFAVDVEAVADAR